MVRKSVQVCVYVLGKLLVLGMQPNGGTLAQHVKGLSSMLSSAKQTKYKNAIHFTHCQISKSLIKMIQLKCISQIYHWGYNWSKVLQKKSLPTSVFILKKSSNMANAVLMRKACGLLQKKQDFSQCDYSGLLQSALFKLRPTDPIAFH